MKYNGETPFNKDRTWKKSGQHYDDKKTMKELEDAYRTSKIWRWDEDITDDREFNKTDAINSVENTIKMWNNEIAPQYKLPKVKPSKHDKDIFANAIYDQFNTSKRKTVMNGNKIIIPYQKHISKKSQNKTCNSLTYLQNSVRKMW